MPLIARFRGISIYMYDERGGKHGLPHFHAAYGEYEASLAIEGPFRILDGNLPSTQRKLVEKWSGSRQQQLRQAWEALLSGTSPEKIGPFE